MMNKLFGYISNNMLIIRFLLWLRGILAENKIPVTLFFKLKDYTFELSRPIPDLDVINKQLQNDVGYLNNLETDIKKHYRNHKKRTYQSIKVIDCRDIIELNAVIDREFVLDIKMDHFYDIYKVYKQKFTHDKKAFYYRLRLSTLTSYLSTLHSRYSNNSGLLSLPAKLQADHNEKNESMT